MTLRIELVKSQHTTIISAYAPTLNAEEDTKENFYAKLDDVLSSTPKDDKISLLGDFNAGVGKDHRLWNETIVKEGVGKVSANGTLLLTRYAEHNLVITNTLFHQQNRHKVSWQHSRSKHWHLIDCIIVRSRDQQDVLKPRVVTGAGECWTDYRLISSIMRMKIRPKRTHRNQNTIKKFNVEALQDITRVQKLQQKLQGQLPQQIPSSVDEHWNQLKNAIITFCKEAIGFKIKNHQDWFDENDKQLQGIIDQKRKAFIAVQNDQRSAAKRKRYQECKAEVQKVTRNLKNQWWKEKACEIQ